MFDLSTTHFTPETPMKVLIQHAKTLLSNHLRDYQLDATLHAISATLRSSQPLLIEIPTGGGKSWICVAIAYVMSLIFQRAGYRDRRTLIICPTDTLVEQNAEKLRMAGGDVAIFCASLKLKQTDGTIIVGTPMSIANSINIFAALNIGCVIVDEAHGHADTSKGVVAELRKQNPLLREFGMTATPYRTVEKYIYRRNTYENHPPLPDDLAQDPYYAELVYRVSGDRLVQNGYLVPLLSKHITLHYDTSQLRMGTGGRFTSDSERDVFVAHDVNVKILTNLLENSKDRKMVMIFCQNIEHAEMVHQILTEKLQGKKKQGSAILYHSKIEKETARANLQAFDDGKHRFMVSVRGLTTGYDNERVDAIVILSTSESPTLLVQIFGRGMRIIRSDRRFKKPYCLLYDYGENIARHFPDGDLFNPKIRPVGGDFPKRAPTLLSFKCPACGHVNQAVATGWHKLLLDSNYQVNENGYFSLPNGELLCCSIRNIPMAAHRLSQCRGLIMDEAGNHTRCSHTWTSQMCPECSAVNDNHEDQCKYCLADLTPQRESQGNFTITETLPNTDLYQPIRARVTRMNLRFENKTDRHNVSYLRGVLSLWVEVLSGPVMKDGTVIFQKGAFEQLKFYFDDHHHYVEPAALRRQLIMNALWGCELPILEASQTQITRQLRRIDYFWAKTDTGWKYPNILTLRSTNVNAR